MLTSISFSSPLTPCWPFQPTLVLIVGMMVPSAQVLGGHLDRREDVVVGPAAADVAAEPLLDLGQRRLLVLVQERLAGHHHARGAEAALEGVALHERRLDGVQL